jgi:hypothetical protein
VPGGKHGIDPGPRQGTDVEDQGPGQAHHLPDLLGGVRHDRRGANGQEGIGGEVHDDIIGDVVDQRPLAPQRRERLGRGIDSVLREFACLGNHLLGNGHNQAPPLAKPG